MKLFEAVPNFSEGRDPATILAIVLAGRSVEGASVLDVESDPSHNRSVVTLAGEGEALLEALDRMVRVAVERIDLNRHRGEHPRMGAVDVIPIVPFGEATVAEAVELSGRLARRLWTELGLPVYLYADSARRPDHAELAVLRRGEFEGIRAEIATHPERAPDLGEPRVHPTAGIVAIGARPVLIAFNANLSTPDVGIAKAIARAIRERDGGLPKVRALGFALSDPPRAQVSMNLLDYRVTSVPTALAAVRREAAKRGVEVAESEIVGLVPEDALFDAAERELALAHFDRARILERRLREAGAGVGRPAPAAELDSLSLREFAGRLAARTPTPGGGSAAAAVAAFGAGLVEMAVRFSVPKGQPTDDPEIAEALRELGAARARLLELIQEDAEAYEAVRAARAERKGTPADVETRQRLRAALRTAAEVPLETARLARSTGDLAARVAGRVKPSIRSDLESGRSLCAAALASASANVRANLLDLAAEGIDTRGLEGTVRELLGEGT